MTKQDATLYYQMWYITKFLLHQMRPGLDCTAKRLQDAVKSKQGQSHLIAHGIDKTSSWKVSGRTSYIREQIDWSHGETNFSSSRNAK